MRAPDQPMIVYDRQCMLCSVSMAFVIRHDRGRIFRLVPAQSHLGRAAYRDHGLDPDMLATMIVVDDGRARTESDAALYVLTMLGWPWRAAAAADRAAFHARCRLSLGRAQPLPLVR